MPRQKKDVWYSFKEIIVGGVKRAKCKTCGFEVVNNAARMEKHMRDCRNVDDDDDIQEQSTSSATTTSSAPPAPKKRQTALNVISTNPTRQHESDILVTRYFIATNTPFNAASNKHLAKLVQFLRPGTTVPDRRRIGGELLDEIYASEQTKVKRMVSGSNVTLAIDGWSTLTNESVLGVSFYHCGKCYLVKTMSTIGESHTTEYLVQVTCEQMEHVRKEFEVNVTSVVTDNAANMNAMRRELALVHTYGCHSHIANLLSKDFCRPCGEQHDSTSITLRNSLEQQYRHNRILPEELAYACRNSEQASEEYRHGISSYGRNISEEICRRYSSVHEISRGYVGQFAEKFLHFVGNIQALEKCCRTSTNSVCKCRR